MRYIKGRCSGLLLSDNGKFFYSILQKRKILGKFKLSGRDKAQPLQKCETCHQLDVHRIIKVICTFLIYTYIQKKLNSVNYYIEIYYGFDIFFL